MIVWLFSLMHNKSGMRHMETANCQYDDQEFLRWLWIWWYHFSSSLASTGHGLVSSQHSFWLEPARVASWWFLFLELEMAQLVFELLPLVFASLLQALCRLFSPYYFLKIGFSFLFKLYLFLDAIASLESAMSFTHSVSQSVILL